MRKLVMIILARVAFMLRAQDWPCTREEAGERFKSKHLMSENPLLPYEPYLPDTKEQKNFLQEYLNNADLVCAIKYTDNEKIQYVLKTFDTRAAAEAEGYQVTHQGRCGACSTL